MRLVPGDMFAYLNNDKPAYGYVISDNVAVLITGNDPAKRKVDRGPIPTDAQYASGEGIPSDVRLAFAAAAATVLEYR